MTKTINDLTIGDTGTALGQAIKISGQVLNLKNQPVAQATIEIWQADHHGRYQHSKDAQHPKPLDPNFHYWGKSHTDTQGNYHFVTIKPSPYNDDGDWRTPHIHFKIYSQNQLILTTQMYFPNENLNTQDNHLGALSMADQKLLVAKPLSTQQPTHFTFNIILSIK